MGNKRIYNVCGREVQRAVDRLIAQRIEKGLTKIYPERGHYSKYDFTHQYIYVNYSCTIIVIKTREFFDVEPEEFKKLMTNDTDEAESYLGYRKHVRSYDEYISEGSDTAFLDMIVDENALKPASETLRRDIIEQIHDIIDFLTPVQKKVITEIYLHWKTEKEVSEELGMTQANIHHHKIRALQELKRLLVKNGIEPEDFEL